MSPHREKMVGRHNSGITYTSLVNTLPDLRQLKMLGIARGDALSGRLLGALWQLREG